MSDPKATTAPTAPELAETILAVLDAAAWPLSTTEVADAVQERVRRRHGATEIAQQLRRLPTVSGVKGAEAAAVHVPAPDARRWYWSTPETLRRAQANHDAVQALSAAAFAAHELLRPVARDHGGSVWCSARLVGLTWSAEHIDVLLGALRAGGVLPRPLCDACYREATGGPARCEDGCCRDLDHTGTCFLTGYGGESCDRCGAVGRLSVAAMADGAPYPL